MDNAANAFQATAGIAPSDLSLLIRTMVLALFLIWAAWNAYGIFQTIARTGLDTHELISHIFRILILCALMIAVVFTS